MSGNANYRKHNDRSHNSSTYHKKDGTPVRHRLKEETRVEVEESRDFLGKFIFGINSRTAVFRRKRVIRPTTPPRTIVCKNSWGRWGGGGENPPNGRE